MLDKDLLRLHGKVLVLGVSSGFGEAIALEFARAGCDIFGVHLDRRSTMSNAERVVASIRAMEREAWFYNQNAADPSRVDHVLDQIATRLQQTGDTEGIRVLVHSLAFGSLLPFVGGEGEEEIDLKQLEMTTTVMAHSLVTWVQGLVRRDLMTAGGRVFAMTSTGAWSAWRGYGAVSASKAALEAHVRQLAIELAPREITVNAICAGVSDTPALRKIPTSKDMIEVALRKNPSHRLTAPRDVALALVALAQPQTFWMTGNVINIDGGEAVAG